MKKEKFTRKDTTYSELKKWFIQMIEEDSLPLTLDSSCKFYNDVPFLAQLLIDQIDAAFEKYGKKNIKRSDAAMAAKNNLFQLWKDLQVEERWNISLSKIGEIDNFWKK